MELVNKVATSGIITIDLESLVKSIEIQELDISQFLFRGLLLKEKEFRAELKSFDWSVYSNKVVAVHCSTDAIVAQWAYMLIANALTKAEAEFYYGSTDEVWNLLLLQSIKEFQIEEFEDKMVVIKGCGTRSLPDAAYLEITKKLQPVVKSLMFGEPCSTVPVYKKSKI
jgi:hypothetical protein